MDESYEPEMISLLSDVTVIEGIISKSLIKDKKKATNFHEHFGSDELAVWSEGQRL